MPHVNRLTLLAVGDAGSKKTELMVKYTYDKRRYGKFMPTMFINNVQDVVVDHRLYEVYFRDADTDDDYAILRYSAYERADCALLCFQISNRRTFESLRSKWCLEIRKIAPELPIVLVATDSETRTRAFSSCQDIVSMEEAEDLKLLLGASALVECSVENCLGIDDVFIEAVRSTRTRRRR